MTTSSDPPLFDQLLAALQHPNPHVRAGAAIALGKTGDARAIEPLADLLEDPVYLVYTSAERALSLIGSLAVGTLMAVIQAPPSLDSASRAYEALRAIHDPQATDLLIAATTYEEPFIRWGALEALGHIHAESALPSLLEAVRHPDENTRQHAAAALGKLGAPEGIQAITTLLNETNWQMRVAAVQALGRIGTEGIILPLLSALRDTHPQVRDLAAKMLTHLPPEAGEILVSALNGADAWTRRHLARAMGEIGYAHAIPLLENLALDDDDVQVRLSAAQALAVLHHPRGETVILRTLNAPSAHTRTWAAIALGNIGNPKAVAPLLGNDPFPRKNGGADTRQLNQEMVTALKRVGLPAVPPLLESLGSPDRVRQETAFKALTEIGRDAVPGLLNALQTTDNPSIRQQVIRLLGLTGDPRAVEPLAEILRRGAPSTFTPRGLVRSVVDPSAEARKLAADALGNFDGGGPALLAAAQFDLDREVRERAGRALANVGDAESILALARPQVVGEVSRAFLSVAILLAVGFVMGAFAQLVGAGRAGLLAGLMGGALVGVLEGLTGQKRIVRGALIGVGMIALWGAFDVLFLGSPPVETLITLAPVRIGALFFGVFGFVGSAFRANPLLGSYRIRFVPRGCLSLGWPVIGGVGGLLVGGVSGAVLMLQAGNPAFFSWMGGISLGVLLVISWLQRGKQVELQKGLGAALGLLGMVILGIAFALSVPDPVIVWLMPLFPAVGAGLGFQTLPLFRRLAGLFGGMIAGFVGAGLGVWVLGMVK
ncbi:MAG: HEAT repeat domain-containing protein [Anaerolineales bacterium]|nr:HEAT repeat domain-containing protein [Anaerolineales bacterium]